MAQRRKKNEREINPERQLKLKECCDMLLAAGYFRVRIANLSPFDKVVGGIVWAIQSSGQGVDVDILFQENSTIGQRIKLSEQLCKGLILMKSPATLQPQQIQGLDYDKLYPVIQWLVRQVIETRRLTGDLVRQLAVSQFGKEYEMPSDVISEEAKGFIENIGTKYKPNRKFRRLAGAKFDSITAQCEATLLEYGQKVFGSVVVDEEQEEKQQERERKRGTKSGKIAKGVAMLGGDSAPADEAKKKAQEEAIQQAQQEEEKRLEKMQEQLSTDGAATKVSGQSVGKFVGLQADEIRKATQEYKENIEKIKTEEAAEGGLSQRGAEQQFERRVETLNRKIKEAESYLEENKPTYEELDKKVEAMRTEASKKQVYVERIVMETKKLEELEEQSDNKALLEKLKQLVMLNESLKKQESQFKQSCVEQRAELLKMINDLKEGGDDEETQKMKEVERIYAADLAKLQKLRQVLAKKNQDIAKVTRSIDDIPTRAELLQYERRFVELFELVQDKLVETRKYYEFYNTLNETYEYMSNEEKLLMSISNKFPEAIKNKALQTSFLDSFSGILGSLTQYQENAMKACTQETSARDTLQEKHAKLVEKQRKYFKAVKEFQEECYRNEKLREKESELRQGG